MGELGGVLLVLLAIVAGSDWLEKKSLLSAQTNRSVVHVSVGIIVSSFPFIFESASYAIGLGALFTALNMATLLMGKAQGMHGDKHGSWGTVWFPVAFTVLCVLFWHTPEIITISMVVLAIADPAASFIGRRWHSAHQVLWKDKKSVAGSTGFFAVSLSILLVGVFTSQTSQPWYLLLLAGGLVAMLSTAAEALSWRGSDNISIPLITAISLYMVLYSSDPVQFIVWSGIALATATTAMYMKALTADGGVATFLVGTIICGLHGFTWAMPLYLFFISGSILSRIFKTTSQESNHPIQTEPPRTMQQVFANGGMATMLAAGAALWPHPVWFVGYAATMAGATADTWSSTIGGLSSRDPVNLLTQRVLPRGTSGGVTALGWVAAGAGTGLIAMTSAPNFVTGIVIITGGILITTLDSLFGATVQGDEMYSGHQNWRRPGVSNNIVNAASTVSGATIVVLVALFVL